jgi:hypothetical protein
MDRAPYLETLIFDLIPAIDEISQQNGEEGSFLLEVFPRKLIRPFWQEIIVTGDPCVETFGQLIRIAIEFIGKDRTSEVIS